MPFADELLGRDVARALIESIRGVDPDRALHELSSAAEALEGRSLRERSDLLRDALLSDVPGGYAELAGTVRAAGERAPEFTGWLIWPVTSAVAARAVAEGTDGAFDDAMRVLAELTSRLTSEFSIRPLLRHDLDRALAIARQWTSSPDEHVRRLASEGTRPYLPWGVRVPSILARPGITVPLLDALYRDESEYVRRSVANHLNDLSRDLPELVVETAARWMEQPAGSTPRVVRHGLRTLVKRGHPGALELLGFAPVTVDIDGPHLAEPEVPWGGAVRFTAAVRNDGAAEARLAIDYVVHHLRANGARSAKTFKLSTPSLAPGEVLEISREHSFRAITTRRYYPGAHAVALQVNGVATDPVEFRLLGPDPAGPGD